MTTFIKSDFKEVTAYKIIYLLVFILSLVTSLSLKVKAGDYVFTCLWAPLKETYRNESTDAFLQLI